MFYVYILQSDVDQSYYIGFTQNVAKRLLRHNNGETTYTKRKLPWSLVYSEEFPTKSEAIKRERFLKAQKNTEFYKNLINSLDR